ncbi:MAG: elongation factor P [Planctomycetes bacterium]|nr:elongation factor P [Planctomycetota bacterium]
MSQTVGLRRGMVIRFQGHLYTVLDWKTSHSGKQRPTVHVKLRELRSGHIGDRSLDELGKPEEVTTETRGMQYLYAAGKQRVFMDTESFEQYSPPESVLGDAMPFLTEEETYRFLFVEGEPLSLQLPDVVVMNVADTAPVEHAGGSSSVYKEARLGSGMTISVPLFIKTGDRIRVSTESKTYLGKEH